MNPKSGIHIIQAEKQVRKDSKNKIKKFNTNPKNLELIVSILFPEQKFSKKDSIKQIQHLVEHINSFYIKLENKKFPSREKPYPLDYSLPIDSGLFLYLLCKSIKPQKVFETGVAYGQSSCFILQALSENNYGKLFSIDAVFRPWETKEKIGSMIPENIKNRWKINFGNSKSTLKKILSDEKEIDIFFHDSLHTYDNMMFEFETAWQYIKNGGFLLSDDVFSNNALLDFCQKHNLEPLILKQDNSAQTEMGIIQKK